jgi:26S proteasome regulatory subunit N3
LDVHNEAVKGMRYPPDAYKKEIAGKGKEDDEKTIEELIKEMEDDMDEL